MMRRTIIWPMCMVVLTGPAFAADPAPDPEAEANVRSLELTLPPKLPPFDPALMERIRVALAAADAASAAGPGAANE